MRSGKLQRDADTPTWPLPGRPATRRADGSSGGSGHRSRLWRVLRVLALVIVLLAVASAAVLWRLSATVTAYAGSHFNAGQNAVWLEHEWAGQAHTSAQYDALAQRLGDEQIGYVFAHVGPLDSDGTIPNDRAPYAAALVAALHARLPNVKVLAWIGQVEAAAGYPASESVNLDDSSVRSRIAQTAAHFVSDFGFDGVHYDIEPIVNNNPRFLDLLTTTRDLLPAGAILSTVGQKWAPNAHVADWLRNRGKADAWWTSYYYAAVAAHVDQLVAMVYNTGVPAPQLYQITVQQETTHILDAVRSASHPPRVLIGLPTYTGDSLWFHSSAENLTTGLSGVVAGLNSNRDTHPFVGVAIYRYGLTTNADWDQYNALWLGK